MRRYNPYPEKHRWWRFIAFAVALAGIIVLMGLRTIQVALTLVLGLYLAWMFRRG